MKYLGWKSNKLIYKFRNYFEGKIYLLKIYNIYCNCSYMAIMSEVIIWIIKIK